MNIEETKVELTDEEKRQRANEQHRKWFNNKYHNDPEFRQRKIDDVKARQARRKRSK